MRDIFYREAAPLWQLVKRCACALALAMLVAAPAQAALQDYTIVALGIDTSREKAEALAMSYARQRAVFLATSKLGVPDPARAVLALKPESLNQIIRGATVQKTQRVDTKSYQQIVVSISEEPLRAALGLKPTETKPEATQNGHHSVLIIPALVTPERVWVWEKENSLRAPLSEELLRQSRGLVILPSGDLQDLRLIDKDNALKVKVDELKPMFERYGADEIVIAAMRAGAEGTMDSTKIMMHRVSAGYVRDELLEVQPEAAEEPMAARILAGARALATAATQIANSTESASKEALAKATQVKVRFMYRTPKELARLTDTIRHAPQVVMLQLPTIMLNDVEGVIYLEGEAASLRKHLAAQAVVVRDVGNEWTVSTR